jgi:hypothetical protein
VLRGWLESDCAVLVSHPPYALSPTTFRFPALASLAGRAPLGGHREVALAAYLVARLAHDVLPERGLAQATRAERAGNAKNWLSTLALPTSVRPALARLVDASSGGRPGVGDALRNVIAVADAFLDSAARSELEHLSAALSAE